MQKKRETEDELRKEKKRGRGRGKGYKPHLNAVRYVVPDTKQRFNLVINK